MDLVAGVRKEGSRGGRADFKWEDVQSDQHRENYLGHSLMAPVGRWQKNRDLSWYAKSDSTPSGADSAAQQRAAEILTLQEAEREALSAALGYAVGPPRVGMQGGAVERREVERVVRETGVGEEEGEGRGEGGDGVSVGVGVGFGGFVGREGNKEGKGGGREVLWGREGGGEGGGLEGGRRGERRGEERGGKDRGRDGGRGEEGRRKRRGGSQDWRQGGERDDRRRERGYARRRGESRSRSRSRHQERDRDRERRRTFYRSRSPHRDRDRHHHRRRRRHDDRVDDRRRDR